MKIIIDTNILYSISDMYDDKIYDAQALSNLLKKQGDIVITELTLLEIFTRNNIDSIYKSLNFLNVNRIGIFPFFKNQVFNYSLDEKLRNKFYLLKFILKLIKLRSKFESVIIQDFFRISSIFIYTIGYEHSNPDQQNKWSYEFLNEINNSSKIDKQFSSFRNKLLIINLLTFLIRNKKNKLKKLISKHLTKEYLKFLKRFIIIYFEKIEKDNVIMNNINERITNKLFKNNNQEKLFKDAKLIVNNYKDKFKNTLKDNDFEGIEYKVLYSDHLSEYFIEYIIKILLEGNAFSINDVTDLMFIQFCDDKRENKFITFDKKIIKIYDRIKKGYEADMNNIEKQVKR